jgi:hypothetical protein
MAFMVDLMPDARYLPAIFFAKEAKGALHKYRFNDSLYEPGDIPSGAIFESSGKTIAHFTAINGLFAVCPEVRDLIESME